MTRGKKTCKILKEIRQQIAEKNDIEYITSECHFQGECQGTCPKCEAELKYLENELQKRRQLGKTAAIAGIATISLGMAVSMTTFSACETKRHIMEYLPDEYDGYIDEEEELDSLTKKIKDLQDTIDDINEYKNNSENPQK
jgi:hypothetical protein